MVKENWITPLNETPGGVIFPFSGAQRVMQNDFTSNAVWTVWVEMSNTVRRLHTCQTSEEEKTYLFLTPSCLWGLNHWHLSLPSRLYAPALHKVCLPKRIQGPLEALFQYKVLALFAWTPLGLTLVFLHDFHNVDVGKVVRVRWLRKTLFSF